MNQGWEVKKISQLFDVKSSKRVHKSDWKSSGIPFYRAREVVKLANNGTVANELFISSNLYNEYTKDKSVPKEGDLIISAVGTLGECYLVKDSDKFYFKDASVLWFANTGEANPNYIEYLFKSDLVRSQIMNGSMGATVGTLTISRAKDLEIPTPPLEEQKQIVAILDKAFEKIEKSKEIAEKNLKNAKELFESYLQEVFENKGDDWEEKTLNEIYDVRDGTHDSPKYKEIGYPLITSKNLKKDLLNYDKIKYISEEDYFNINKRSKVDKGDILFAMIGTIGNPVVIENETNFAIKNVALFKVPKNQNSYFLKYYLDSKFVVDKMKKEAKGTTQQFVGLGYLRNFKIKIPSSETQKQIVTKLSQLQEKTKKLETIYQQKLTNLEELKKSILQKAFNGELETIKEVTA
jgi:type I restriction enzyme, S subunit